MAMKRLGLTVFDQTFSIFQRSNKRCFSRTNIFRNDGQGGGGTSAPASGPNPEKGTSSGYMAAPSQNYAKVGGGVSKINTVLTPPLKQNVEPTTGIPPASRPPDSPSFTTQHSQDARREASFLGGATERQNVHLLKTSLDQTTHNLQDDVSLLASRRVDPSTVRQVYYFDTLAFTKKLESRGFTREQAEGCAECLVEIINTTLDHQGRHMVTKPQQEIAVQQLMSEIVSVKKDMTLLQKSEFSSLKTETEKISITLSQVQGHMGDEIVKLKGQFSLDINLERGRAIEAHAENEKKLQQLHNKIETEIANLKTIYEVYRNDVFKYAGGTVIAVGGLMLGVIRLWH